MYYLLLVIHHLVSFAVDSDDAVACFVEESSQVVDLDREGTRGEIVFRLPQCTQNHMTLHQLVQVAAEQQQQIALARRHVLTVEGLVHRVEHTPVDVEYRLGFGLAGVVAAKDSANTKDENIHRERLGDIIIAAQLKGTNHLIAPGTRGEHYYR